MSSNSIDITFDFRKDAGGRDVDKASPTLKRFHQLLWSKPLPNGQEFSLLDGEKDSYLDYKSKEKVFHLSSDAISNSYRNTKRLSLIINGLDKEVEKFQEIGWLIGGYIVFPKKSADGGLSINQARGFNKVISDRFDFTLECIKCHYLGLSNPLENVLNRNADFFQLFSSFAQYVEFFLLQDLVDANFESILFFTQVNSASDWGLPKSKEEYLEYMQNSMAFTQKRNERIQIWAENHLGKGRRVE